MSPLAHPRMINRQVDGLAPASAVDGIAGATTKTAIAASTTGAALAVDGNVSQTARPTPTGEPATIPPIVRPTSSETTAAASSTASLKANAASSQTIPIGTVVGACVGALVGALFLIGLGVWLYRRSAPPARDTRSFSKLETADPNSASKEKGDHWEGKYPPPTNKSQTQVPTTLPKSENNNTLDMFQKKSSPSLASAYSTDPTGFTADGHAVLGGLAGYTPGPGQGVTNSQSTPNLSRPFAGRADDPISWGGETIGDFSVRASSQYDLRMPVQPVTADFATGAMSPSVVLAIPTPVATAVVHRWEVAEVEHFDHAAPQPGNNQTLRPNNANPFFGAKDNDFSRKQSVGGKSQMSVSADGEHAYVERARENAKGKQRARTISVATNASTATAQTAQTAQGYYTPGSNNPFAQPPVPTQGQESPLPPPESLFQAHHTPSPSNDSALDTDSAMRSLIAALEVQPQPQRQSVSSQYTDASEGVASAWAVDSPGGFR